MGRIGRLVKTTIENFIVHTVETRLNFNQGAKSYAPAGFESVALPEDKLLLVKIDGTGRYAACGALTERKGAEDGEVWIYSRDENREVKAVIKILKNGDVSIACSGNAEIRADGDVGITCEGSAEIQAGGECNVTAENITATGKVKVTGGSFECGGSVSPSGSGALCAVPSCLFTGAPHVGNNAQGT